jgi:hypothetical protein
LLPAAELLTTISISFIAGLNKYSSHITQPKSQGASQAMLYATGRHYTTAVQVLLHWTSVVSNNIYQCMYGYVQQCSCSAAAAAAAAAYAAIMIRDSNRL